MDTDLTYSQVGQDLWVLSKIKKGYFIDIAAGDGVDLSNTYLLEKNGWNGICVEPSKSFMELITSRTAICVHSVIWSHDGLVKFTERGNGSFAGEGDLRWAITIRRLFDMFDVPEIIDYISLDVEGSEYEALLGFPWEHKVRMWTIEHNFARDGGILKEKIKEIMTQHGYKIAVENVYCGDDPFEDWWIHPDLISEL